tara:strand:+ start:581 stop:694 length:114 start_codon:yes stop_codon:yes gene_type:complete
MRFLFTITEGLIYIHFKSGNIADLNKDEKDCQTKTLH